MYRLSVYFYLKKYENGQFPLSFMLDLLVSIQILKIENFNA